MTSPTDKFDDALIVHLPRLRAYAMVLTRNRASADDLLQETSYRALRAKSQFVLGTNFTAWVYQIMRNSFISSLRRAKWAPIPIDDAPESFLSQPPDQENIILSRQVMRAVEKLNTEQQRVLTLICAGGLTYSEAAKALNCSVATIKSRLWRARRHMASLIEDNNGQYMTGRSLAAHGQTAAVT